MNKYDDIINELLDIHIQNFFKIPSPFENSVRYSLSSGKKIRPKIALDICNSISNGSRSCGISSLAIEYIHTASLIIDDLPCMDNSPMRRNKESLHVKYNEAIAQLTSVLLVSMGMHSISYDLNQRYIEKEITLEELYTISNFFINNFSHIISHNGSVGGQLLDLHNSIDLGMFLKETSVDYNVEHIIKQKTGTFFETSFLLGWLIGGGSIDNTNKIKQLANDFAMVFQITDDIEDMEEDTKTNKKNVSQNYALRYGIDKAIHDSKLYLSRFKNSIIELKLYSDFFKDLIKFMKSRIVNINHFN